MMSGGLYGVPQYMYMGPSAPQAKSRHSVPQSLSRLVLVTSVRGEDFAEQAGGGIQIEYSM